VYLGATGNQPARETAPTPFVADTSSIVDDPYVPPTSMPGATEPPQIGLVLVAAPDDWRTTSVATTFDRYFTSVNNRDYATAAALFDASGVLDPTDPAQVAAFARDMSTTTDSEIVLGAVTSGPDGAVLARVTFRSTQQAGYGPPERPDETCTDWNVTYVLSTAADGAYRILRGTDVTSGPC